VRASYEAGNTVHILPPNNVVFVSSPFPSRHGYLLWRWKDPWDCYHSNRIPMWEIAVLGDLQINADYRKKVVGIHHILKVLSLTAMTVLMC